MMINDVDYVGAGGARRAGAGAEAEGGARGAGAGTGAEAEGGARGAGAGAESEGGGDVCLNSRTLVRAKGNR
jgi:hypothetical protein